MMKFVLKPSLELMAIAKIVISLWNQNDVRALISKPNYTNRYSREKWETVEKTIIKKVPQLSLPQQLKEKVLGLVKPIGFEIKGWVEFHCMHFHFYVDLPAELCWSPLGKIDRKRTAELLVKCENLNISTRYKLACIYCLEDDIHKLWNSMPEDIKESNWNEFPIISFWSRSMKGEGGHIDYKDEFYKCVHCCNKVAAEYFLQKLTPREREESLVEAEKYMRDYDILFFLISEMDEEKQMEVFKKKPDKMLACFLHWPLQRYFIEIANCVWDFLSNNDYYIILISIVYKVEDSYKDWNYQELFREFWQKSPNVKKSSIINKIDKLHLLPSLFRIKDKENIRLILKDATLVVKEKLMYHHDVKKCCRNFIQSNEWDFLNFCIQECLPSKEAILKFKENFEKHMCPSFKEHFETKKQEWDQLFRFSNDSICKHNKRNVEGGESSSSKRFQSLQ